ncbi:MAG: hypothetical protein IT371_09915 [Deltaproteobacteria bacterium]|nr:hypothetical protein [Deltaproteobacteria bacterium]
MTPLIHCDSSSSGSCVDGTSGTIQIKRKAVGSTQTYYLQHNDTKIGNCPLLALTYTDSDSLTTVPHYDWHVLEVGSSTSLGPATTGPVLQVWRYKLVWAVYGKDGPCSATPVLGCTDTASCAKYVGAPGAMGPIAPPPDREVFLYNKPWWDNSKWRGEAYLVNLKVNCAVQSTITTYDPTAGASASSTTLGQGISFQSYGAPEVRQVIKSASFSTP